MQVRFSFTYFFSFFDLHYIGWPYTSLVRLWYVNHCTSENSIVLVPRRGKVFVCELQRAAGEGRRSPQVPQPGRLQEEEGTDLTRFSIIQ